MTNLTEKWKQGKLEDGAYYYTENGIEECHFCEVNGVMELVMPEVEEVLAPVPSYEEWRNLQNSWVDELDKATRFEKALNNVCEEYNQKLPILEAENDKLEDLLKECRIYLNGRMHDSYIKYLLTKIDEVLK